MKSVTFDQVMGWGPCYNAEGIAELFAGQPALSAEDIVALEIPTEDKIWALLHNEFLTDRQMHELACDFAERVAHLSDDPRVPAAIAAKRAWLRGEITDEELAVAWAAAWDAAWDAAWAVAWAAAGATAKATAGDAARAVALAAARAVAGTAAWATAVAGAGDAAWVAAQRWQLDRILQVINGQPQD